MSYILNALQKSEQSRQQTQQDLSTNFTNSPTIEKKWYQLTIVWVLLLINLLLVGIFLWKNTVTTQLNPVKTEFKANNSIEPTKKNLTAISAVVADRKKLLIKKNIETKIPIKIQQKPKPVVISSPAAIPITSDIATPPIPKRNYPPLLNELELSFRNQVPHLQINAFAYAEIPAQRFVIINMVKYRGGEEIAIGMILQAILPNSLKVEYRGQVFRYPL